MTGESVSYDLPGDMANGELICHILTAEGEGEAVPCAEKSGDQIVLHLPPMTPVRITARERR